MLNRFLLFLRRSRASRTLLGGKGYLRHLRCLVNFVLEYHTQVLVEALLAFAQVHSQILLVRVWRAAVFAAVRLLPLSDQIRDFCSESLDIINDIVPEEVLYSLAASGARPALQVLVLPVRIRQVVDVVAVGVEDTLNVLFLEVLRLQDGQRISETAWVFEVALDFIQQETKAVAVVRYARVRGSRGQGVLLLLLGWVDATVHEVEDGLRGYPIDNRQFVVVPIPSAVPQDYRKSTETTKSASSS